MSPEPYTVSRRLRRGSALVSALMVLLVLVGLIVALAPLVRVEVRSAGRQGDELRAFYLAKAGVHLAVAALQQDDATVDGMEEDWAFLGEQGQTGYPLGEGQCRMQVLDAASRLDLNRIDRETLLRLPDMDEVTADAILAWRGGEEEGAGNGTQEEASYYESLPRPYRLKAAPFDSVEELLLVQGVTPSRLYGLTDATVVNADGSGGVLGAWIDLLFVDAWGPNQDLEGQARVDLNAATQEQLESVGALDAAQARAIVRHRSREERFNSLADLLSVEGLDESAVRELLDHVTLTPSDRLMGRVNLNTAPAAVLESLPNVTTDMADRIIERRESEGDFQTVGDLLELDQETFRALADHVTTKSSVFVVRVVGELENGVSRALEAWVVREDGRARVIRWRELPGRSSQARWGWNSDITGTMGTNARRDP